MRLPLGLRERVGTGVWVVEVAATIGVTTAGVLFFEQRGQMPVDFFKIDFFWQDGQIWMFISCSPLRRCGDR